MIRSIFTRDGLPASYDPAVAEAIIAEEMKFGEQAPSGTYIDMAANLPIVDPKKVQAPVLMLRGEFDGNSTNDDLLEFYRQLPNGDRQFMILPKTAHSAGCSKNRHLLWHALKSFLAAPSATADQRAAKNSRSAAVVSAAPPRTDNVPMGPPWRRRYS